ncbi:ABC transporter permease, partial [Mesorhizobium sp. M6A.T.Ce.TU.002.03.1.1]
MSGLRRMAERWRGAGFATVLLVILIAVNLLLNPTRFHPSAWGALIGLAAPLIGAALASAPVILAGRGGIDISVGPLMGFVNAIVIQLLFLKLGMTSPLVIVPAALLIGAIVRAANG